MTLRSIIILTIAVSASMIAGGCGPGAPDQAEEAERLPVTLAAPSAVEQGRAAFIASCASCHGEDGRGYGPVAEFLTIPVPDLVLLEVENDGRFPDDLVFNSIDGRQDVRAHGSRDMPVWGNIWTDGEVDEEIIWQRTGELVEYIRSIQAHQ